MEYSFEDKLDRILKCSFSSSPYEVDRSLVHAYIACLTMDELCEAICRTIEANTSLRMALRSRLLRLARLSSGEYGEQLARLVVRSKMLHKDNSILRRRVDALHSAIYQFLPISTRQDLLEGWIDRGKRGAMARWLKAIATDKQLFDGHSVLAYWRVSRDPQAAKIVAYEADPALLDEALSEMADLCEEGWIVSKAALRASTIPERVWTIIRGLHPASYAYLCAQTGRTISDEEAFALVQGSGSGLLNNDRGLAIWSIGQMGLVAVLDRISDASEDFAAEALTALQARLSPSGDLA